MKLQIQLVKNLVEKNRFMDAIAECERLLRTFPEQNYDILRVRAYAFAMSGDYDRALVDYGTIINDGVGSMADYYLAAFDSLHVKKFDKASEWFRELLHLGEKQNEEWFKSASYFYLAYAQMELGHYDEATVNLDEAVRVSAEVEMPIPKVGMCRHDKLRAEIERRSCGSSNC